MLVLVPKSDYTTRRANGIFQWASVVSWKNQNSSYRCKFLSRETNFSSSEREIRVIRVRVNRVKLTEKWGQIQGKWHLVRVSWGVRVIRVRVIRVRVTGVLLEYQFRLYQMG